MSVACQAFDMQMGQSLAPSNFHVYHSCNRERVASVFGLDLAPLITLSEALMESDQWQTVLPSVTTTLCLMTLFMVNGSPVALLRLRFNCRPIQIQILLFCCRTTDGNDALYNDSQL